MFFLFKTIINRLMKPNKDVFLGRTACLGNFFIDWYRDNYGDVIYQNQQKVRVDIFLEYINGTLRPQPEEISMFLKRKDILPLIEQQKNLTWLKIEKCKVLIMDSYAELTDQKFISKTDGSVFSANYMDIDHSGDFDDYFVCKGLLSEEHFEQSYNNFFQWVENKYPDIAVYFFHFSTKLENREKFKFRAKKIEEVMCRLAAKKKYIHNIIIEDADITPMKEDDLPYHYGKNTYEKYFSKFEEVLKENENYSS